MPRKAVRIFLLVALFELFFSLPVQATEVGRFEEVEGRVEFLKKGELPAAAAQQGEPLNLGDMVRTKSGARAVIRFVDDTLLTIAPESRVVIQEYLFDADKSHRRAVLKVLQGLVGAVVPRLLTGDNPSFLMETHTASMGVRGTEWYAQLSPQATDIYTVAGSLEIRNRNARVGGKVITQAMQYTRVTATEPPTFPVAFSKESLRFLKQQLSPGISGSSAPNDAVSSFQPQAGLLLSFWGDRTGILTDFQLLDRNLAGTLRESNLSDFLAVNLTMPPRLDALVSNRDFRPGRRDIMDRFDNRDININPGTIVTPGLRPGLRR